ncbi:MAG: 2TM domain-containing protein [Chlorobi bacterium]|jgi:hypothetical protein|nr:2TM domain-containing protein [Chlorobiota bacterium]
MNISISDNSDNIKSNQENRRFTHEELQAILKRALDGKTGSSTLGYEDILDTAKELGISPQEIDRAIYEQNNVAPFEEARNKFLIHSKEEWRSHVVSYAIVNTALFFLSIATGGEWFVFPLIGWGIGLAFHTYNTFFPSEKEIEKGVSKLLARQTRLNMLTSRKSKPISKKLSFDIQDGKFIIEKGDKRVEIGGSKKNIL